MSKKENNIRTARPRRAVKVLLPVLRAQLYATEKRAGGTVRLFEKKAIRMYVDGTGLRRTGRQLGIHHQTVANWAKEEAEQLPETPVPAHIKTSEFDELFTFIGDKKTESISVRWSIERHVAF